MTIVEKTIFKNRKINPNRLLSYGFLDVGEAYSYETMLIGNQFRMTVEISASGDISTRIVDTDTEEEYVLHRASGACGAFVGMVKDAYEAVLLDISQQCFEADVFKSEQAKELIRYVRDTYGDELEFLWQKFPDNAVWRRKDTGKWYAALLTVSKNKLGLDSSEKIEILDLRLRPEELEVLVDNQNYFPGYHMNKKHWYTILLNDSVSLAEIQQRVSISYQLAIK